MQCDSCLDGELRSMGCSTSGVAGMWDVLLITCSQALLQQAEPESSTESAMSTAAYLAHETTEKERAMELWKRIITHEASHLVSLKVSSSSAPTSSPHWAQGTRSVCKHQMSQRPDS